MRASVLALVLLGCSDYGINEKRPVTEVDPPAISVDPGSIEATGLCAATEQEVRVRNDGEGALTIADVAVEGDGWTVTSAPSLPLVLASGESTIIEVEGTAGEANLIVRSDDPVHPRVDVPLLAALNTPPTVSIAAPTSGVIFAEGADYLLEGSATDAEDPAETLSVEWLGGVDGLIGSGSPAADGTTTWNWAASSRSAGPQGVTLTATDACGATGSASTDICQDGANTYDALALSAWHYEGSAAWDAGSSNLLLTPATTNQVGSAFETSSPVNADNVDIDFYVYIGGGTGADGLSLTALDTARYATFLGGTGCGIGYGGSADCTAGPALPGWTLEIDTYYNGGVDPTAEDHLAFTFDGDVDAYQAWATLPEMEDTGWHYVEVSVVAPHVSVAIDGVLYLDQDIPGNYAFSAFVGFTAGTGGETNEHRIDELTVTDYSCD